MSATMVVISETTELLSSASSERASSKSIAPQALTRTNLGPTTSVPFYQWIFNYAVRVTRSSRPPKGISADNTVWKHGRVAIRVRPELAGRECPDHTQVSVLGFCVKSSKPSQFVDLEITSKHYAQVDRTFPFRVTSYGLLRPIVIAFSQSARDRLDPTETFFQ